MRLIVECDGGSRGNPGAAGTGSTVKNTDGEELGCVWKFIDHATNNVAEYNGLINGLTLAVEIAEKMGTPAEELTISVNMDSKLVVEQMSGRWKIKHPDMKPLAQQAKEIERPLAEVTYTWVPRNKNARADELANRAMDDKEDGLWIDEELTGRATATDDVASEEETKKPAPWYGTEQPTRLILLRHGQTTLNKERKFSGRGDAQLTTFGRTQANRAALSIGSRGGIDKIISSPLQRCQDTATACATALGFDPETDIEINDQLIEMDFGQWEAMTFDEVKKKWPDGQKQCFTDITSAPHGGESIEQVYDRTGELVTKLCADHPGETLLLVSHMVPIKSMIRRGLAMDGMIYQTLHLDVASLSIVEFFPSGAGVVRLVNDTHYLA